MKEHVYFVNLLLTVVGFSFGIR